MLSGRRERIAISCVTFETTKITDPIKFYEATKIHLIHYVRDPNTENGKIYTDFYKRVCEIIETDSKNPTEIIEHIENVNDFTAMLRTVLSIIEEENSKIEPSDIFVNISAGTSEYAAAAAIASMMTPGTIPFSVATNTYKIKGAEEIRDAFYQSGKPIGLTATVREPKRLPRYSIPIPDKNLIMGLKILDEMNKKKQSPKGSTMIKALKEEGLWRRDSGEFSIHPSSDEKFKETRSDSVYYHRDYISKWQKNGWIYKDEFKKRYFLTEEGKIVLNTFYCELDETK